MDALVEHDGKHASTLREGLEIYLPYLGDVRGAATALQVHRYNLRYRLRRVEEIAGGDLQDASAA